MLKLTFEELDRMYQLFNRYKKSGSYMDESSVSDLIYLQNKYIIEILDNQNSMINEISSYIDMKIINSIVGTSMPITILFIALFCIVFNYNFIMFIFMSASSIIGIMFVLISIMVYDFLVKKL